MSVRVMQRKAEKIRDLCLKTLQESMISIREFASIVGKVVAASKGVEFGLLDHRCLETEKMEALKR